MYDYSDALNSIFTINPKQPIPEAEPNSTPEAENNDDDDHDHNNENYKIEEVETPEEYIPDPILIESDDKESDDEEVIFEEEEETEHSGR